jgi:CRP-like cAMP-binding protein
VPRSPRPALPALNHVTDEDAATYALAVRRVAPLNDAAIAEGLARVHPRAMARGKFLLRAGDRAREIAVVVHGLVREYSLLSDGTERTKALVDEGYFTGSLADLLSGQPSRAYVVAEEPTRLLVASQTDYAALSARFPAWERFARRALELLLLRKAEREYELLGLDAEARYTALLARWPGVEARVAARHIASYLGITPVHLSRLRRLRRDRRRA